MATFIITFFLITQSYVFKMDADLKTCQGYIKNRFITFHIFVKI